MFILAYAKIFPKAFEVPDGGGKEAPSMPHANGMSGKLKVRKCDGSILSHI